MAYNIVKTEGISIPYTITIDDIKNVTVSDIKLIVRTGKIFDVSKMQYGETPAPEYDKRTITNLLANTSFTYLNNTYCETITIAELMSFIYDDDGNVTELESIDLETVTEEFIDDIIATYLESFVANIDLRNRVKMYENAVRRFDYSYNLDI